MTTKLKTTTAQEFDQEGNFWGKNIQDIMVGDKFNHDGETFTVEDVELVWRRLAHGTAQGCKIKVGDASICVHGEIQSADQWFNEDAKIEWL